MQTFITFITITIIILLALGIFALIKFLSSTNEYDGNNTNSIEKKHKPKNNTQNSRKGRPNVGTLVIGSPEPPSKPKDKDNDFDYTPIFYGGTDEPSKKINTKSN